MSAKRGDSAFAARAPGAPAWVAESPLLELAYALAAVAHRSQRRPSDNRLFLDHATEVAGFLREAGFDEELIAAGLLHDSVERGTLDPEDLRREAGEPISSLVLDLSEDPAIESFAERKAALRSQVKDAGGRALTIFAADKLSDIGGLRRGFRESRGVLEERIGTSVDDMAAHYRESVELIESERPGSAFLPALRIQLDRLALEISGAK